MTHQHHHLISNILHFIVCGFLGLAAASLANSFGWRSADRLPGESRWPNCAFCQRKFTWQEIFPLFGWMLRPDTISMPCPCGERKGLWTQPVAEVIGFMLGMAAYYLAGWGPMACPLCLGLGLLPAMALVDFHFGIIPDGHNILIALFGLCFILLGGGDIYYSLITSAALLALGLFCALVYSKWRGKEMLGLGDVKFFAAAGLWLEPHMAPWFLAMAGFFGAALGFLRKKLGGEEEFPFAPALCISLAICVLFQLYEMP